MTRRLLAPWRSGRLWPALVHVVLDVPVGVLLFAPTAALIGATLGAAVVLPVSIVTLVLLLLWTDLAGTIERSRVAALLDERLDDPVLPLPRGSLWRKLKALVTDRSRWKQVAYCVLRLPAALVLNVLIVGTWAGSLAMTALPAYVATLPQDTAQFGLFGVSQGPAAWAAALVGAIGGMGLGLVLGWGLVRALVASEGFGTFAVPVGQLAIVLLVGAGVGVLASLRPARRASRLDVLDAIAAE